MDGIQSRPVSEQTNATDRLRELPSVDRLLNSTGGEPLSREYGRLLTLESVRQVLEESRIAILAGELAATSDQALLLRVEELLRSNVRLTMRPVINATGVIIHTNLGRAVISQNSLRAVAEIASNYSNLEYDLDEGSRGSRNIHAEGLLRLLTGAEAAHTVNNNAAAVLLMLAALCSDKEVIISRGQLIEIGGGFRVPEVMVQSGARLVEVGTTNRTHARDYVRAITDETAAILVAHHSNFQIVGFTNEPELEELAQIAHEHRLLLLYDQGSGAVRDTSEYGLESELTVQEALRSGADLVAFSGDKLLGGPQAGILCGKRSLIDIIKAHPLSRALRADKMCLAALSATLRAHVTDSAQNEIPVWRMIAATPDQLRTRADAWMQALKVAGIRASLREGFSTVGGGSLPGSVLPTWLVALEVENLNAVAAALRIADSPVIGRIADDQLLLDPRTVLEEQDEALVRTLTEAVNTQNVEHRHRGHDG